MTAPLRIGVIGCADIARRKMLPAMAAVPGAEAVAVASRDPAKAAELAARFGCRPVHGYAELLGLDDVDAVYIPLPPALHSEWVAAALAAGKHVLVEKPLTTDLAVTRRLLGLARSRGLALMENVMFVHHSQHAAARRMIGAGAIGELRALHAAFAIPALPDGDIRFAPELGGGAVWDIATYPVRAALSFLGPGLTVVGAILDSGPGRLVDTSGAALLHAPGQVAVHLTFGLEHAYGSSCVLWGSTGRLTLRRAFTPPADHHPVLVLESRAGGAEEIQLEPDDQAANTVAAFVAAARAGRDPAEADTLRQAEILDEIRRTAVGSRPQPVAAGS
jgi:predicted dehydrogenase